ncbi:ThiF family adenylyltransferase [Massilia sp. IC2-477]|uniref:HesA/MoeB/ThiF family protein n=1 Tax=unclassified Massilia TaxID=2609279 RepID=UPI001D103534|nr:MULTISPECIES: ThiF family adenylyltransferase [unclassified Massilia]MCC2955074.1 ThiF family adenylyltransferase [Massilia sp. IC2-477]MCC2973068.1 ThiF family adenylyltransferase [Massilia sp. IC2-476]
MTNAFDYDTFTTRNNGYVSSETQAKIRSTRLLIAGCGLGASTAICAARMGFSEFILIDGDTVDAHNLNRQFYDFDDIGSPKVQALKKHILRINPEAKVEAVQANLDATNAQQLVGSVDIIFDTIDFLDLEAILALHTNAREQKKAVFTALSIGFGAGVLYFPAGTSASLADVIAHDVQHAQGEGDASYANVFGKIMGRIGAHLDRQVVEQVAKALTIMEDGRPCPASQIAVGSFTVAALAVAMMHDMLAGMDVPASPNMVVHSFRNHTTKLVNIAA